MSHYYYYYNLFVCNTYNVKQYHEFIYNRKMKKRQKNSSSNPNSGKRILLLLILNVTPFKFAAVKVRGFDIMTYSAAV